MLKLLAARSARSTPAVVIAAATFFSALLWVGSSPANAHDALVQTSPEVDSVVTVAPSEVTMTYSGEVLDAGSAVIVEVIDPSGADVASTAPVIENATVTQTVAQMTTAGIVTVRWRVVSSDGHPISGEYAFTLALPEEPTPVAAPEPTATSTTIPTPQQSSVADAAPEPQETQRDASFPLLATGAAIILLAGAAVVVLLVGRRRRRRVEQSAGDTDGQ